MSINTLAVEAVIKDRAIPQPSSKDDVLAGLTKYIPTESITLYVAVVSSLAALKGVGVTPAIAYWFFIVFTPVLMIILYLRQSAIAGKEWRIPIAQWPWWKIIASTIAFSVWALAVPSDLLTGLDSSVSGVLAGLAALFVSTLLNLLAPFFEKITQNAG